MKNTEWNQIKVTVNLTQLDSLTAIMSMLDSNLMTEDFSDIDLKTCYGDLIDESILNADKTIAAVSLFVPEDKSVSDYLTYIKERTTEQGIDVKVEVIGVCEEDWANSWRKFFKPTRVGNKIVIVPMWEDYTPLDGDIIIKMDPGMAFGTGTHETTRLVIAMLERYVKRGDRVLDVGCGSGILSICASKLGASECRAYDIDPLAVSVARENVVKNKLRNVDCEVSDLLRQVVLSKGKYNIVCANIVADIIIKMAPDVADYMRNDGVLLASGIIVERADEVCKVLIANGFTIKEKCVDNGWCALAVTIS